MSLNIFLFWPLQALLFTALVFGGTHSYAAKTNSILDLPMPTVQTNAEPEQFHETQNTHPPLYLTPDKSELVRLDTNAASIIIGNPAHVSVLTESPKTLIFVPQELGATFVTILDKDENIIMQRHVISSGAKDKYIRIRRSCAGSSGNCNPTQVYYCPGMCHEIKLQSGDEASGSAPAAATPSGAPPISPPPAPPETGNTQQ